MDAASRAARAIAAANADAVCQHFALQREGAADGDVDDAATRAAGAVAAVAAAAAEIRGFVHAAIAGTAAAALAGVSRAARAVEVERTRARPGLCAVAKAGNIDPAARLHRGVVLHRQPDGTRRLPSRRGRVAQHRVVHQHQAGKGMRAIDRQHTVADHEILPVVGHVTRVDGDIAAHGDTGQTRQGERACACKGEGKTRGKAASPGHRRFKGWRFHGSMVVWENPTRSILWFP